MSSQSCLKVCCFMVLCLLKVPNWQCLFFVYKFYTHLYGQTIRPFFSRNKFPFVALLGALNLLPLWFAIVPLLIQWIEKCFHFSCTNKPEIPHAHIISVFLATHIKRIIEGGKMPVVYVQCFSICLFSSLIYIVFIFILMLQYSYWKHDIYQLLLPSNLIKNLNCSLFLMLINIQPQVASQRQQAMRKQNWPRFRGHAFSAKF